MECLIFNTIFDHHNSARRHSYPHLPWHWDAPSCTEAAPSKYPALSHTSYEVGEFLSWDSCFHLQKLTDLLKSGSGIYQKGIGQLPELTQRHRGKELNSCIKESLVWTPWWLLPLSLSLLLHGLWDDSQLCLYLCIILQAQRPGRSISSPCWRGSATVCGFLNFLSRRQDPPSLGGSHSRGFPKIGR